MESGLSTHLPVVEYHLQSLRGALAVARALNRTLLLPELPCYCDKTWGGHDNIFKSQCMYPGAQVGGRSPCSRVLPGVIPGAELVRSALDGTLEGAAVLSVTVTRLGGRRTATI